MLSLLARESYRLTKLGIRFLFLRQFRSDFLRRHLLQALLRDGTIKGGPFQGILFTTKADWSGLPSKLIGTYEAELIPTLEAWSSIPFTHIIDIGSADGYYALGCAKRWPCARVIAYEAQTSGQVILREFAAHNHFGDRIESRAHCSPTEFAKTLQAVGRGLVVMDVEGYEDILLDRFVANLLENSSLIIELHDLQVKGLGDKLTALFQLTHNISQIWTRERRLADFNYPKNLLLRLLLINELRQISDEQRGAPMRWFVMQPKRDGHG